MEYKGSIVQTLKFILDIILLKWATTNNPNSAA